MNLAKTFLIIEIRYLKKFLKQNLWYFTLTLPQSAQDLFLKNLIYDDS